MSVFTKITRIEWKSVEHQYGNEDMNYDRIAKIDAMLFEGKTDGIPTSVNETVTERAWLDQAAAQEYIDFIVESANTHGLTLISATILDAQ